MFPASGAHRFSASTAGVISAADVTVQGHIGFAIHQAVCAEKTRFITIRQQSAEARALDTGKYKVRSDFRQGG
jgi:hypothetical protein